jgi:tetratricopeptide (TPR) repeat protein
MELNPSPPVWALYTYADYLTSMGRFDEALAINRRAVERDPLSPAGYSGVGFALMCLERYDQALDQLQKVAHLVPRLGGLEIMFAEAYIFKGRLDEAARHTEQAESLFREAGDRSWLMDLVWGYAREHRRADALRVLNQMDATPVIWKATAYAGLDQKQKALDFLEQAYERHEVGMVYIKVRHTFDPVRHDPRFQRLLKRMNLPE